jgi:YggT family protein
MYFMLLDIIAILLNVVWWLIVIQAVLSWLIAFNVINTRSDLVMGIYTTLERMTEPLYRPLRRIIPNFGNLDLTPMVVLIIIIILRGPVLTYLYQLGAGLA